MSSMKKTWGEQGAVNVLLIPVILLAVLFIGSAAFGFWAFGGRQDYKNNSDQKVAVASDIVKKSVQAQDAKLYAEQAKQPLTMYIGPDSYGSVRVVYPKTWSTYVDLQNSSAPLDAYFHTGYVPAITTQGSTYNLHVQVMAQNYSSVLTQYSSVITSGDVQAIPYALPKVPSVTGTQLVGKVFLDDPTGSGEIILLPLRDKTLAISTQSPSYFADFKTYILPNLTFSP